MKSIHFKNIPNVNDGSSVLIRRKRERLVFKNNGMYYKIWVPNWQCGDITKHCFDVGYYDEKLVPSISALIHDETGQRGYVTKPGKNFSETKNDWSGLIKATSYEERKKFMKMLLERSLLAKGVYFDLCPGNVVVTDEKKISLIDLESFSSFKLMFERKKENYEKFDIDAWWKPAETAKRDFNEFSKSYINQCLGFELKFNLDSIDSIRKAIEVIR